MLDRRTLFPGLAALGSAISSLLISKTAKAGTQLEYDIGFVGDVEPRGTDLRLERLPTLDLESQQDFLTGFRSWSGRGFRRITPKRTQALFEAKGLDPNADPPLETVLEILGDDPVMGANVRTWCSNQLLTWKTIQDYVHANAEVYFSEMEAADKIGPGTLELNPDMIMPDHVKHEIHIMPGGYVGDPLGGYVYHYGTNNFYGGGNFQDEIHIDLANKVASPKDGRVLRILDVGCTTGQMTVALKERFPNAEVWGIDAGGPMIRYGHMRAVDLGVDVNFAQRLAEDTRFPDGYFDIVTSYILFHEMPASISDKHVKEAHRILRKGGVFFPIDFYTGSNEVTTRADLKFRRWWDHRWNDEVWFQEYDGFDMPESMRNAGFDVDEEGPPAWIGNRNILGTKVI
ncbi:MAG: class I SAM-dependent methyltransferase [Rhodospirillaceae bacterium]